LGGDTLVEYKFPMRDGEVVIKPKPDLRILYIELTTRCNLACDMCFKQHWMDVEGDMDHNLFLKILDDAGHLPELKTIVFGGIGEPTVHPRFEEMVYETVGRGYKLYLTTNGLYLSEKKFTGLAEIGISGIYFSIDAVPGVETRFQHIGSRRVVEIIKSLASWRRSRGSYEPLIGVEVVVTRANYSMIPTLVRSLREIGVDEVIISNILPVSQAHKDDIVYDGSTGHEDLVERLESEAHRGIKIRIPSFQVKTERKCLFDEARAAVIRWDGEVVPCYRFLHTYREFVLGREKIVKAHSFGNVKNRSLKDIWMSREYSFFRFITRNYYYPSCTDCRLNTSCDFVNSTEQDCWGNTPSCADCLWARDIVQCPIPSEPF